MSSQSVANRIMNIDADLLEKYHKDSGTAIDTEPLRSEFVRKVMPLRSKITPNVLDILENENFHTSRAVIVRDIIR